jgi:hypothetical protein
VRWLKVADAAKEWAGDICPKTMYAAIRAGKLKAARIGAGRNVLVCEAFVDEWLTGSARRDPPSIAVSRDGPGARGSVSPLDRLPSPPIPTSRERGR